MSYKELPDIKSAYDSGFDNILHEFYIPVLQETVSYKRLAGFFTSSSLAVAAKGIAGLIKNNGHMQMVVSPRLTSSDIEAINKAIKDPESVCADVMLKELDNPESYIQKNSVKVLSWMLANGILEMKIARVYDKQGKLMTYDEIEESGLFHIKVGVLEDKDNNIITFSGSINESANAWINNVEEFKVFKDWEPGKKESTEIDIRKFNQYWNGTSERVEVSTLPNAVYERLLKEAPKHLKEIEDEIKEIEILNSTQDNKLLFTPFDYQLDALKIWEKNHSAIFEMATGTGKTKTAELCIQNFISKCNGACVVFIICPQDTLAKQWLKDISQSGLMWENYIIADSDSPGWKEQLPLKLLDLSVKRAGKSNYLYVYSTFDTYCTDYFSSIVNEYKNTLKYFLIGDEVHGLGSGKRKNGLLNLYDYRLGLSATPERWFDDEGTNILNDYFGTDRFVFSMHDALTKKNPITGLSYLTPYMYKPSFITLDSEELFQYKKLTEKIIKKTSSDKDKALQYDDIEKLLFMRSNIHKNAINKYEELEKILDSMNEDYDDTIIFVSPEQIDEVESILNRRRVVYHRFTKDQGKKSNKKYGGISEREYIIERFKENDYQILVAIKCLDEGIDIPSAKRAILMASSTNPREFIQRIGRVIRRYPGKDIAYIYDMIIEPSYSYFDEALSKIESKIFQKEMIRVSELSENALNRLEIINEIYNRLI